MTVWGHLQLSSILQLPQRLHLHFGIHIRDSSKANEKGHFCWKKKTQFFVENPAKSADCPFWNNYRSWSNHHSVQSLVHEFAKCVGHIMFPRLINYFLQLLSPNLAASFSFPFATPMLGQPPLVFLFSVLRWAVTPQLLSLYCFSMPRSLHKSLKERLKRELKLQLSIRMTEQLTVTFYVPSL